MSTSWFVCEILQHGFKTDTQGDLLRTGNAMLMNFNCLIRFFMTHEYVNMQSHTQTIISPREKVRHTALLFLVLQAIWKFGNLTHVSVCASACLRVCVCARSNTCNLTSHPRYSNPI